MQRWDLQASFRKAFVAAVSTLVLSNGEPDPLGFVKPQSIGYTVG